MSANIMYLGHSTFQLTLPDQRVVLIDPWLAENPACPPSLKKIERCDLILLTHGHGDHIGEVDSLIGSFDPLVIGNFDLCNALQKTLGRGRYGQMGTGGTQSVDGLRVSLTQACHASSIDTPQGPMYAGMPNGLVVAMDGLASIYHAGDTDVFGDMKFIAQLFAPDICILPIGDHFTMGAKGAALAAEMLNPTTIIPCHYKTFPMLAQSADEFRSALSTNLQEKLFVLPIGEPVSWTAQGLTRAARHSS